VETRGEDGILLCRTLPPRKFLSTHFCYRLSGIQGYWMRTEGFGHLRTFPRTTLGIEPGTFLFGAVPQQTAPQLNVQKLRIYPKSWHNIQEGPDSSAVQLRPAHVSNMVKTNLRALSEAVSNQNIVTLHNGLLPNDLVWKQYLSFESCLIACHYLFI
jgi:hypothetical protein